jgi:hypothetical protein
MSFWGCVLRGTSVNNTPKSPKCTIAYHILIQKHNYFVTIYGFAMFLPCLYMFVLYHETVFCDHPPAGERKKPGMPQIEVVSRDKVPVKVSKGPTNTFDQVLVELKPNEALKIVPDEDDKGIGSIKMQLNNARKRTGKDIDYWDDGEAVYVALVNNVPTSNGHNN